MKYLDNSMPNPDPNKRFHYKKQQFNIQLTENGPKLYRQFKRRKQELNLPVAVQEHFSTFYMICILFNEDMSFCPICNLKQVQVIQPPTNHMPYEIVFNCKPNLVVQPIFEQLVEPVNQQLRLKRNKRTSEFDEGDKVSVLIPRIDRGGSDLPRLPGFIGQKSGEFYEIVTEFGILND
ncbi:hypothetical protein BpHYR1_026382 [Brachionus plicatilis]|uniref:Uncharacterized protein n=1 Tax=Brachionus plicatilis TaxID=10195 RepID=A0A3M7SVE3_BRAPC|nr:hypothetical protein BpHYR1_026382 [Brachionus plicatilis]